MDAVGKSSVLSPAGDAAGLNLGADSETLALFASLFAMMQAPQPDGAATLQKGLEAVSPDGSGLAIQTPLPAAAMLMSARGLNTASAEFSADDVGDLHAAGADIAGGGDAAHLVRLLLAARDIAMPDGTMPDGTMPEGVTSDGTVPTGAMLDKAVSAEADLSSDLMPASSGKTATEMLTGAIEILRSLEAVGAATDTGADANDTMSTPLRPEFVMARPSAEFVGPMPTVTASTP
ncbi:MAG: hypothetical protein ACPG48_04960, partial [Candidatus Puniceispirillaceae bacterium]